MMKLFDVIILILSLLTVIFTIAILTEELILGTIEFVVAFKIILIDFLLMTIVYMIFLY